MHCTGLTRRASPRNVCRRVVDQKASKGRKLRFDIQPKLVNFMFPMPDHQPSFAASLFDNLFKAS